MDFYGCTQGNACAIRGRGNPRTIFTTQWKFWGEPCSTPPFHPGLHDLSQASWFGGIPRESNEYKNNFEPITFLTSWFRADVKNDRDVKEWKSDCVGVVRVTNGIKSIHSHSLARPHSKGLRRCAAPQNTQPASLGGKLKHFFFPLMRKFWKEGALLKSVIKTWVLCQFWMTDVLVQTLLFRPPLNTQPASGAIWWCSHRSPTLSALSSLLIVLRIVCRVRIRKKEGVASVDGRFALKSFGSIITWHSPFTMKTTTGKAVK